MSSQYNNQTENQEQVFSEDQFRPVYFDSSKRSSNTQDPSHIKRARLDPTLSISRKASVSASSVSSSSSSSTQMSQMSQISSPSNSSAAASDLGVDDDDVVGATNSVNNLTVEAVEGALQNVTTSSLQLFNHDIPSFVSTPTGCATPSNLEEDVVSNPSVNTSTPSNSMMINAPVVSTPIQHQSASKNQRKRSIKDCKLRKYRSRSLPNILFASKSYDSFYPKISSHQSNTSSSSANHLFNTLTSVTGNQTSLTSIPIIPSASSISSTSSGISTSAFHPPLPPVNIQSLKEIDLAEIIKNPQLRHDILFDPQLQFRPNLDGERGRRKKITYDKYWNGAKEEIEQYASGNIKFNEKTSRLPTLFLTLREILISLLPSKDKTLVTDVLDIELIMQQLVKNSLDFISLAKWLSEIFKSHCAPMRDSWVDEMILKFVEANETKSTIKLVEGLRMIFTILEAMKLDIANHQIRILRPVLIETAVEFERDYFLQMISRCKLDINDSIKWFKKHHNESKSKNLEASPRQSSVKSILSLLSCSHMVSEFPSSLAFDHSRLIVLRANIRQLVCLNLCLALYRQLVCKHSPNERTELLNKKSLSLIKKEILAIITDDNGNVKWTRNIGSISLQIVRRALPKDTIPKDTIVEFGFNWLIKQTQPSSQVYSLMEQQIFNSIRSKIEELENSQNSGSGVINGELVTLNNLIPMASGNNNVISNTSNTSISTPTSAPVVKTNENEDGEDDLSAISSRIALVCKFHWQVFGSYYSDSLEK